MTQPDPRQVLLNALLQQLQAAVSRCAAGPHPESVHEVRVAARRLRAMVRCLRAELHPMIDDQLRFDLTNLSRMLGEVRAADIRLQLIASLLRQCTPTSKERSALHALATHARRQAEEALQRGMQEASWHQRMQRLADALAQDELLLLPTGATNESYRALMHMILRKTSHALRTRHRNVDALHQQRIRIKNARYVCETLLPQIGLDLRRAVAALDKGQDLLGELHDLHALGAWLDSMAGGPLNQRLTRLAAERARRLLRRFHQRQPKLRRRLQNAARALRHSLQ